ncbi:DNA-binding protein [Streptomyces sp. WZ.A104]|uniref:helix-turn-helix domain-containing protein n=1 Tax=Streptomyces sp. WZ.A104 TaxID=2023771 RepID=UPI000BBB8E96|nr:helix-turn-helix domain-containing protein [Streptomyces sp. WZ.A104]PCG87343.1 DNA-binding protein [Streptomyces sp. WZ.A104]
MESDERELYSIGEVAERLGLHVRTVRNYVRDGKLRAVRIGKQYRISREDFEALTGRTAEAAPGPASAPARGHLEVSSIVQIDGLTPDAAHRLSTLVTASAQSARSPSDSLRIQTVYDQERARMKIVVLGGAATTAELLHLIDSVTGPDSGLFPSTESGQGADHD